MSGKGDKRRPTTIPREEAVLRYELAFCKDDTKRAEILRKLAEYGIIIEDKQPEPVK